MPGMNISEAFAFILSVLNIRQSKTRNASQQISSDNKYFDLYNNAPSMFISIELPSGKLIECNETLLRKTGFKREDVIGNHYSMLYHHDCLERADICFKNFVKNGELKNIEFDLRTIFEGKIPVLQNSSAVRDRKGIVLYSRTVLQDITGLKRIQDELRQSEERFRSVAENAIDSIITVDSAGIIIGWNQGAKRAFGYSEDEIIGQSFSIIIPTEYRKKYLSAFFIQHSSIESTVVGSTIELKGIRKNKEIFPIELSLSRWESYSDTFFTGIIRDITERKLREEELLYAKKKAEESDLLKSAFLANMSHEIRTPLNGIIGFSHLLIESDISPDEKISFVETIDKCSYHLLQIVSDILDISKIEAGEDKFDPVAFNVSTLLEEVRKFFEPQAKEKNLKFSVKDEIPQNRCIINNDKVKLWKSLDNIISNALKFTEAGTVSVVASQHDNTLVFKIQDTGIGIEKSDQEKIFNRFWQAEVLLSRNHGGTGLGLSLAKCYIEKMGGNIRVDSVPKKGSTFIFEIPLTCDRESDTNKGEQVHETQLSDSNTRKTILVAEDEIHNSFFIKTVLKRLGLKVIEARNGSEAVNLIRNVPEISLVLMDIKMPVMDGITATNLIKSIRNNLPVIATTAYAYSNDKEESNAAGFDDFLTKPISKETIISTVGKYLNIF
jgi:PAS domain S-box-containing protein